MNVGQRLHRYRHRRKKQKQFDRARDMHQEILIIFLSTDNINQVVESHKVEFTLFNVINLVHTFFISMNYCVTHLKN